MPAGAAGLVDRLFGWATKYFERRRRKAEANSERLLKTHALLTRWERHFPALVEAIGFVREAANEPNFTLERFQSLLGVLKKESEMVEKVTPNIVTFIADNYLLLPVDVGDRLKEIEALADPTPVILMEANGKERADLLRQKCMELMRLIETRYLPRREDL